MIEDDFYATIKLKTGEEIFTKVSATEEDNSLLLLVVNPIIISEIKTRGGSGYKIEPWIKTTSDDMFIINMEDVLTMSESKDIEIISIYQSYVKKFRSVKTKNTNMVNTNGISRRMGYISTVSEAKKLLEKIYRSN